MGRIPRITVVLIALGLLAVPAAALGKGYRYGVASGEVTDTTARVWTRSPDVGRGKLILATDKQLNHVVHKQKVFATEHNDQTIQRVLDGLDPATDYFFRFCDRNGPCSEVGRFSTAPAPDDDVPVSFGYSGDMSAQPESKGDPPFFGHFLAVKAMREEGNDFNINLGDTIYSDPEVPGAPTALTVSQKWGMYKQNLGEANLRKLRASASLYSHWDDHEFINDFSMDENGEEIYKNGKRAFRDYAPVSYTKDMGLYRTARWGQNLELFFLDERSFRSAKASANGVCDNPDTNEPDLAPTAPPAVRTAFAALIPSLTQPVSQACKDELNDPSRTLLGEDQFDRFLNDVESSTATWKVVVNETPIQQFYGLPYDRWEGYAHERIALLQALDSADVENLAFITTDTHANFVNTVRERTLNNDVAPANATAGTPPINTNYMDFVTGPVGTKTFFEEIDDQTGAAGNGGTLATLFFKPQPPNGVGMACAQGDQFSFAEVNASSDELTISYKEENGDTVQDVSGGNCGPYTLANNP